MRAGSGLKQLGWTQVILGLLIIGMAASFLVLYGREIGSITKALGQATTTFAAEAKTSAVLIEQNRHLSKKLIDAVASYKDLGKQVKESSAAVVEAMPKVEEGTREAADACGRVAKTVDATGDRAMSVKYPSNPEITYTQVKGISVPTGVRFEWTPLMKDQGENLKAIATDLRGVGKTLNDSADRLFPQIRSTETKLAEACDRSIRLLESLQASVEEVDQRRLPEVLQQMRTASYTLAQAGGRLSAVQPLLWWGAGFLAAIGLLCLTNGILILRVSTPVDATAPGAATRVAGY